MRAKATREAVRDHAPLDDYLHQNSSFGVLSAKAIPILALRLSELILKSLGSEGLHDSLSGLRLDKHHLAEHLPLASLGGSLLASLDHRQTRNDELAGLLHLSGAHAGQGSHGSGEGALGHHGGLHHRSHGTQMTVREIEERYL